MASVPPYQQEQFVFTGVLPPPENQEKDQMASVTRNVPAGENPETWQPPANLCGRRVVRGCTAAAAMILAVIAVTLIIIAVSVPQVRNYLLTLPKTL